MEEPNMQTVQMFAAFVDNDTEKTIPWFSSEIFGLRAIRIAEKLASKKFPGFTSLTLVDHTGKPVAWSTK
jgi:hypothetical protein